MPEAARRQTPIHVCVLLQLLMIPFSKWQPLKHSQAATALSQCCACWSWYCMQPTACFCRVIIWRGHVKHKVTRLKHELPALHNSASCAKQDSRGNDRSCC